MARTGRVTLGHNSLTYKNHKEILSGLDIGPFCISVCSFFFSSPLCYWFHHLMLLPTSVALIEVLFTFYSVYNRVSLP